VSGTTLSSGGLDTRRRRLLFRSWHRGSREMDLIIGRFADAWIARMSEAELDEYERLIGLPDPDLYAWIAGREEVPADYDSEIMRRLRAFQSGSRDPT